MKKLSVKIAIIIVAIILNISLLAGCVFTSTNDHYDINLKGDFEVTFSISCNTILTTEGALQNLPQSLQSLIPKDGIMLDKSTVLCENGDSVVDLLKKICAAKGIKLVVGSDDYVSNIGHLEEQMYFNNLGGWMYKINSEIANIGAGQYTLKAGDNIEWHYTCEIGDID